MGFGGGSNIKAPPSLAINCLSAPSCNKSAIETQQSSGARVKDTLTLLTVTVVPTALGYVWAMRLCQYVDAERIDSLLTLTVATVQAVGGGTEWNRRSYSGPSLM